MTTLGHALELLAADLTEDSQYLGVGDLREPYTFKVVRIPVLIFLDLSVNLSYGIKFAWFIFILG